MPLITLFPGDLGTSQDAFFISALIPLFDLYSVDAASTGAAHWLDRQPGGDIAFSAEKSLLYSFGYSVDLFSQTDSLLTIIRPSDLAQETETSLVTWTTYNRELFILSSQSIPTRLSHSLFPELETQIPLGSLADTSSGDLATASDIPLLEFINHQSCLSQDQQLSIILLSDISSLISTSTKINIGSSGGLFTELVSASDVQLEIILNLQSSVSSDLQILILESVDLATQQSTFFRLTSIISTSLEQAYEQESFLTIIFGADFSTGFDSVFSTSIIPPPSTNSITDVFISLLQVLNNSGVFGPNSANFVIDPDSVIIWPVDPPPFALLQPLALTDTGNAVGGGRFTKVWEAEIAIHIVTENFIDESYKDKVIVTSEDTGTGPNELVQLVINMMEQSYPVNAAGQLTLIELPFFLDVDPIRRYKGSNIYSGIPIRFRVLFRENLPAILP